MQNRHPIPPRRSAIVDTRRAGYASGIHPDDAPYLTAQRKQYSNNPLDLADGLDYPGEPTRIPSSAVRYVDTQGNQVIQRGNKRLVIHDQPPLKQRRRPHWMIISGLSMFVLLVLWWLLSLASGWWTQHQLDTTYEFPRIFQTDAIVYPGDTAAHPSHYLFLNLQGTVLIVELPHGDSAHARIYKSVTLFSDNAEQVPITGEFRVVNGKVEMLVHIQDRILLYINNGTQFVPQ